MYLLANALPDWAKWVIIGAAAALLLVLVLFILKKIFSARKKTDAEKAFNDRDAIATNAKIVDVLIAIADGREELVKELQELREEIKYLQPSEEKKVYDFDMKIKNQLDDFKIVLTKADKKDDGENEKVMKQLKEIRVLVAERNVKV